MSSVTLTNIVSATWGPNTYEYAFTVPTSGPGGAWTYSVLAKEGTENTVSDTNVATFSVYIPVMVTKYSTVYSDPINGTTNPKAIPGAVLTYTLIVTNSNPSLLPVNVAVLTDNLAAQITAGHLAFKTQYIDGSYNCPGGSGIVVNGCL